jgi:hypothetical protein
MQEHSHRSLWYNHNFGTAFIFLQPTTSSISSVRRQLILLFPNIRFNHINPSFQCFL